MGWRLRFPLNDCGAERFDQNELRQLLANGQARVADLADEIRLAGQELDDLVLAQAYARDAVDPEILACDRLTTHDMLQSTA